MGQKVLMVENQEFYDKLGRPGDRYKHLTKMGRLLPKNGKLGASDRAITSHSDIDLFIS